MVQTLSFLRFFLCTLLILCSFGCEKRENIKNVQSTPATKGEILLLDYGNFTIWLDCKERGAVRFQYYTKKDTGNAKRAHSFHFDPEVPERCQQISTNEYQRKKGEKPKYDRGHLVPANHFDDDSNSVKKTNVITNILPQVAQMNRGAWLQTEMIIECYRDLDTLFVIGGVLWGNDQSDDYFTHSHGVRTPDAFWKIIIRGEGNAIAWVVENTSQATHSNLDSYLVSVRELERLTGEVFEVLNFRKDEVLETSWQTPIGCDRT